ncbi:hypothetical protein C1I98_08360 [Spongiactinospora gelatinilytica]|uniref:Endonuclease V n=1 Tax=Spongiactinospora gelatinilytica TaxID=2666298 RepID=A0A2W2INQ9_9ACTN|nr:hypothetical protein C1I98_08360 [Spongiactinospora gelatinilytica]
MLIPVTCYPDPPKKSPCPERSRPGSWARAARRSLPCCTRRQGTGRGPPPRPRRSSGGSRRRLTITPDLLVCDGYGLAHPRRFGLACHLGVLTGLPVIGVAKTPFAGRHDLPARERGSWTPIVLDGEVVGRALRTREGVKPVYVSQGHRVGLDEACGHVLRLAPAYRIPEPIRRADRLSRGR